MIVCRAVNVVRMAMTSSSMTCTLFSPMYSCVLLSPITGMAVSYMAVDDNSWRDTLSSSVADVSFVRWRVQLQVSSLSDLLAATTSDEEQGWESIRCSCPSAFLHISHPPNMTGICKYPRGVHFSCQLADLARRWQSTVTFQRRDGTWCFSSYAPRADQASNLTCCWPSANLKAYATHLHWLSQPCLGPGDGETCHGSSVNLARVTWSVSSEYLWTPFRCRFAVSSMHLEWERCPVNGVTPPRQSWISLCGECKIWSKWEYVQMDAHADTHDVNRPLSPKFLDIIGITVSVLLCLWRHFTWQVSHGDMKSFTCFRMTLVTWHLMCMCICFSPVWPVWLLALWILSNSSLSCIK